VQKVIQFLINKFNLIVFLLLEILCFFLIYSNNSYQSASFYNSSNAMIANVLDFSNNFTSYFNLRKTNAILANENAKLRFLLSKKLIAADKSFHSLTDSSYTHKYRFVSSKVINNSVSNFHNYLTINKGSQDSILPGMGVICPQGVVGKVKSVSTNFATITSLLHKDMIVSSKLIRTGAVGSVRWEGINPNEVKLMYIPRHIGVKKGDTVVTSEYNSVFPEGEMIGIVKEIQIKGDENFYNIDLAVSTDFTSISYVYVVKNQYKTEQDSLEVVTNKP
jgi:rod shape-determining protein MreC